MKIVLVGRGRKKTRTEYFVRSALEHYDHSVHVFDDTKIAQLMGIAACQLLLRLFISLVRADLVYFARSPKVSSATVRRISAKLPTVMWYFDIRNPLDAVIVERAKQVWLFITVSSELSEQFKEVGVKNPWHLPQAFPEPILHMKPHEKLAKTDVAFIGNNSGGEDRIRFLRAVGEQFELTVWGSGWEQFDDEFLVANRRVFNRDYANVCQNSKIILAFPSREAYSHVKHYFSNRVWLTLGSGGFLLHRYHKGMEDYFEDGVHLVFFGDLEDALRKIDYYLDHAEERRSIARRGQEYVLQEHTYNDRVKTLLDHVSQKFGLWR